MTSHEPTVHVHRARTRRDALAEICLMSCAELGELCAGIGLDPLDGPWWRRQCRIGLHHAHAGRERFVEANLALDVIERTVRSALVSAQDREQMVDRFARIAVNHARQARRQASS